MPPRKKVPLKPPAKPQQGPGAHPAPSELNRDPPQSDAANGASTPKPCTAETQVSFAAPMGSAAIPPNTVQVAPSLARRLGAYPGSVVEVVDELGGVLLALVLAVGRSVVGATAAVHPETHAVLPRSAVLRLHPGTVPSAAAASLCFSSDSVDQAAAAAAFLSQFADQVVFSGMRFSVRAAARSVEGAVQLDGPSVARVTLLTEICARPTPTAHILRRVLVTGPVGCGKTTRLRQVAATLHGATVDLDVAALARLDPSECVAALDQAATPGATLLLDDLDVLCGSQGWAAARVVQCLVRLLDDSRVSIVASATRPASLPAELCGPGRFVAESVRPPETAEERERLLAAMLLPGHAVPPEGVRSVAAAAHGYSAADLGAVTHAAKAEAYLMSGVWTVTEAALRRAAKAVRPSALRGLEVTVPTVRWGDIGGSDAAKAALQDCVRWSLGADAALFAKLRMAPPRGVLLFGPPGCSKTLLAKALASESGLNFISVKGPEVFSKWVGDSEKAVRDVFARARAVAPCVVFIDELDGMCAQRGQGGVGDRVISQFLTELDGLPAAVAGRPDRIVLVAATNRPDNIDGAVLRPGRIDRRVYVGLPGPAEREAIVAIALRRTPVAADVEPTRIAAALTGYTGAEVVAVCKEAMYHAVARDEDASAVTRGDFEAAVDRVQPRIQPSDVEWYKAWGR